ncbi:hypothetical protein CsSME_00025346 [Camellia sinensis var. sinensis]
MACSALHHLGHHQFINIIRTLTHRRLLGKAAKLLSSAIPRIRLLGISSTFLGISTSHPSCPSVQHNSTSLQPSGGSVTGRVYSACPRVNLRTTRQPFHTKRPFNHNLRPFINSSLEDNLASASKSVADTVYIPNFSLYQVGLHFFHASKNLVAYQ